MFNDRKEVRTLLERVEVLSNEKWDAINNSMQVARQANNRLFDDAVLVLSGIEGKLKFAVGINWDKKNNIQDDFTRDVVEEAKESINNVRHALNEIMIELREGIDKPLSCSVNEPLAEAEKVIHLEIG